MSRNPYEVLGISEHATDEEIKAAYRALAKKYHPDKYIDNDLKEIANEKMKEINEAYDAINAMRAGKDPGYYSSEFGYASDGYSSTDARYAEIRRMINAGAYTQAEAALDALATDARGAEWHFLKGCVLLRRGWVHDAAKFFDAACRMDPYNQEYRNARLNLERMSQSYSAEGGRVCGGDGCDCCTQLICTDCCCECMGGDLIPCC